MLYFIRRIAYAIPILIGVNLITFVLFFMVNSPDDMARAHLGEKRLTSAAIESWKQENGYDKPLFYNAKASGSKKLTDTLYFNKSVKLFAFNFGESNQGRNISYDIYQRMWPSLAIAVPTLLLGLAVNITFALLIALFRGTYFDQFAVFVCVVIMSISSMFYIIIGQFLFGKVLRLVPISGYEHGLGAVKFVILPILIGVVSAIGAQTRWYRTIFLEEMHKQYVRTARSKGLSAPMVLFRHVLKNALLPILTGIVVVIPTLFLGSLIMESFFGIPGLGSYTIDAIAQQDFDIVRAMVFLGTVFYIVGLILTDLSYLLVDPRVKLTAE
jgi:peptide/nickel transport system permease protein